MTNPTMIRLEKTLLILWFILNLGIGVLTVREYGVSIDEPNNYRYAADTLDAYPSLFGLLYEPKYDITYDGHGPSFVAIAAILIGAIQRVYPNVFAPDLWHFSYFITFQLTGLCLYFLTKRWFNRWTAWGVLILFGTQPLLLGHAFINPKDIPFMLLLTGSIVLGFRLVDSMEPKEAFVSLQSPVNILKTNFLASDPRRRKRFLTSFVLAIGIAFALVLFSGQVKSLIELVVTSFYTASSDSWAGRLFASLAGNAAGVSAENYVTKALRLFRRAEIALLLSGSLCLLIYFALLISNKTLQTLMRSTWHERHKIRDAIARLAGSLRNSVSRTQFKTWIAEVFAALRSQHVILAGIVLGVTTGLRAIAPWAGAIVVLYMFVKVRSRAWTTAIAYFLIAGVVTYIAWPHLWGAPIHRYLEGLGVISDFPYYPQRVLFNGQNYPDTDLPRSYLPVLLNIQFTEPYLLGAYIGLGVLIWRLVRDRLRLDLLLYIGLGFAFPLFALILLKPPLYNNFRQALFLIPPMFMLAAFSLELLFNKINQSWARILLIAAISLPGVYSTLKLYPYQYIYYNSLVGGMTGSHDRYELDYMRISLREAALELNEVAPLESTVVVNRSAGLFVIYSRPDLVVDKVVNSILNLKDGYDFTVQVARGNKWDMYQDIENLITIEREGAVLATVKDMKNIIVVK